MNNTQNNRNYSLWQFIESWLKLPQEVIERFPKGLRATINQKVEEYAKNQIAETRLDDIAPIARRQPSSSSKTASKLVVACIGALTFSAGTQVLTSRLGSWGLPAAMTLAAGASYIVDDRATKFLTGVRKSHSTQQTFKAIVKQRETQLSVNELQQLKYQTQTALVEEKEGKNLDLKPVLMDGGFAAILSAGEYIAAVWIVTQLGLTGGLLLELVVSSIPVALIWSVAAWQSDRLELPEYYADLMQQYLPYLYPPEGVSEQEVQEMLEAKETEELRLNHQVIFIAQGDDTGRLKNLGMATYDYDLNQLRLFKHQLEQERNQTIEQRLFKHRQEVGQLPNQFTTPEVDQTGWTPQQIKGHQEKVKQYKVKWVEQKTVEFETLLQDDLKMISAKSNTRLQQVEEEMKAMKELYLVAERNYQENEDLEDNLGGAA